MGFFIRPISTEDTSPVLSLYREAVLTVPPGIYTPSNLREWASRTTEEFERQNASRRRFVAQIATKIVGYAGFDVAQSTLTECYVLPSQQGAGIGQRLVGHIIALARGYDLEALVVLASKNAELFYAKMGFSALYAEGLSMADGEILPCVRMKRLLAENEPAGT